MKTDRAYRVSVTIANASVVGPDEYNHALSAARRELWNMLSGVEGQTIEFHFPGPWPNSTMIEFVRAPEPMTEYLFALMNRHWGAARRAGFVGAVEEAPE